MTFCDLNIYNDNPLLIRFCTELDLLPNFEWFPLNIWYGCGMPTGDAYSSGHLVPSLWDLHMFYLLRPILFPNLSLFYWTMLLEYPSVLSRFCLLPFARIHFCGLFSAVVWDIKLKFCIWICVDLMQIRFEFCHAWFTFTGVIDLCLNCLCNLLKWWLEIVYVDVSSCFTVHVQPDQSKVKCRAGKIWKSKCEISLSMCYLIFESTELAKFWKLT